MRIDADLAQQSSGLENDPCIAMTAPPSMTPAGIIGRRAVDFALALCGILALAPVFGLVALLIKLDSPGSILFRQKRVGLGGKLFEIFKFRTMVQNAYKMGSRLTVKRDPRITRLGQLLRWSKIDELPQLFNVVRGEMSLIGPRPEDPHFVQFYTPAQRRVLLMRPGIVGPSQIEGRDEVESYPDGLKDTESYYVKHIMPPKLARDLEYVEHASFWGDMGLLVRGVWITVRGALRAKYLWRRRRRIALMGVDLVLSVTAYALALLMRFDWQWPAAEYTFQTITLVALLRPPMLLYFGAYQGIASYFGLWDLVAVFKAVTVGSIAAAGVTYFVGSQSHPRSVFVIDWALLLFLLSGMRYALRIWTRWHPRRRWNAREKVLIVGAGHGGEQISRALIDDPSSGYRPVGFIDEAPDQWGSAIHGIKVLGGIAELPLALSAHGVRVVFVCLSDLTDGLAREAAEMCGRAGVECRMLPALSELLNTDTFAIERSTLGAQQNVAGAGRG